MINGMVPEGIILTTWKDTNDPLFRMACFLAQTFHIIRSTKSSMRSIPSLCTRVTWSNAQEFASMNNGYLARYGVNAVVTGISVDAGDDAVLVQVSANLDRLFPSVVPGVIISENGSAQIRVFTK